MDLRKERRQAGIRLVSRGRCLHRQAKDSPDVTRVPCKQQSQCAPNTDGAQDKRESLAAGWRTGPRGRQEGALSTWERLHDAAIGQHALALRGPHPGNSSPASLLCLINLTAVFRCDDPIYKLFIHS